ncbi:GntR family transcriptional regulator [Actinomadura sp. 9N407]|uniref:GntR family transcriptional regulator n=1 Tax=Actinomadura sp. 9N407 TaxID=3375154 RepID=UPI00378D1F76
MLLRLTDDDPRALHEQVAAAIRRAIATGECAPGERVPPARELATALDINPNTVLRALRQLRDEGLLDFRRGRGIRVAARPETGELTERVRELVADAERLGVTRAELVTMIEGVRR